MNRSGKQWAETLPSPLQELLLMRFRPGYSEQPFNSLANAVNSFTWIETPEGKPFWSDVAAGGLPIKKGEEFITYENNKKTIEEWTETVPSPARELLLKEKISYRFGNLNDLLQYLARINTFWQLVYKEMSRGLDINAAITATNKVYKTAKEWFNEHPDENIRILANYNSIWSTDNKFTSFGTALNNSFNKERVDQPDQFWAQVITGNYNKDEAKGYADIIRRRLPNIPEITGSDIEWHITCRGYYDFSITFYKQPFQNCQNFVIGAFESILSYSSAENAREIVSYFSRLAGKQLLIVDIHNKQVHQLRSIFKNIIFEQSYNSTNGSQMTILMINCKNND